MSRKAAKGGFSLHLLFAEFEDGPRGKKSFQIAFKCENLRLICVVWLAQFVKETWRRLGVINLSMSVPFIKWHKHEHKSDVDKLEE